MKKSKLLPIRALSVIICLVLAVSALAYDFAQDGIYYTISGTNASVTYKDTNYNSYNGTVNIPSTVTYNGTTYTVSTIGYRAFQNCTNLKRVVIPNTAQYIGSYAFSGCTGLTNITIPASMYTIYSYAFDGCTKLKSVICLSTHAAGSSSVGTNCFSSTTYSNATLYVPSGTVDTFSANTTCWGNFTSIKEMACDFAEDAIFYKDLGNNCVAVRAVDRFAECYSGEVEIPSTVTHNGTTYTVTSIATEGLYSSLELTRVSVPATVNEINPYAFYDCRKLTSVNIPNGVTDINYCAFGSCYALTSITIPESVEWIAQNAFVGDDALTSITCKATTPPMCVDQSCFTSSTYSNATLYVPSASLEQYQQESVWQNFSNIVARDYDFEVNGIYYIITGSNTASVTYRDKNYNSYSGTVNIPTTVTHEGVTYTVTAIGRMAFRQCDALTSVSIPITVTEVGYASFYQCESLTSVNIPNSVTTLGNLCFQRCTALQRATLGTGITEIPQQCFTYCSALSTISIPANVNVILPYAFYDSGLESVSIAPGVDSIYYYAFGGCSNLTSISFPATMSFIDQLVLEGCNSLATITVDPANPYYCAANNVLYDKPMTRLIRYAPQSILTTAIVPNSCIEIEMEAFSGASNLDYIYIGPNVKKIGNRAFTDCSRLKGFYIPEENTNFMAPDGVLFTKAGDVPQKIIRYPAAKPDKHYSLPNTTDTIALSAFEGSSLLESVYIPSSVKAMASSAFSSSSVKRVVIDEGLKLISNNAFYGCSNLESIYLPSTITEIGSQAFYYSVNLSEMTIAVDGQTPIIGEQAFYGLAYYTDNKYATVYVPNGMAAQYEGLNDWLDARGEFTDIQSVASGTEFTVDSLTYVTTDDDLNTKVSGVTSKSIYDPGIPPKVAYTGSLCTVTALGNNSLSQCTRMVRADVPFTVSLIDGYAFYGNTNLQTLKLHEGLKQISQFSISHVDGLTTLSIPASVDSISETFVTYSNNLSQILVENGNTKYVSVDGVLFSKNKKILVAFPHANTTDYTVPDGTVVISNNSFRGASNLNSVTLPTSLREIQHSAFFDNTSLTSMTVPRGVTKIENSAFGNCTSMTSAELPSTLTTLGYRAFYNTPNLTTLTVKNPTPPTCETRIDPRTHSIYYAFDNSHYTSVQLIVPRGSKAAYQAADTWKNFTNIIEQDFPAEGKRGDVNDDDVVDIEDVTALISNILGNASSINQHAADVNEDGSIDIEDVTAIINYILNGSWPEPASIDMWYIWGYNVGDNSWASGPDAVGRSLIPLFPEGNFTNGKGILTYTAYFNAYDFFRLIHGPDNWDDAWGCNSQGEYGSGPGYGDAISIPGQDGYYTITFNTATMEFSLTPYTGSTPQTFNVMTMPGEHNYWSVESGEYNMSPINLFKENHEWVYRGFTVSGENPMKFAADHQWDANWGDKEFPYGVGQQDGNNIVMKKGTYDVYFNDITGHYNFIRK